MHVSAATTRLLLRTWLASVALVLVAFAGVTAHGVWRAIAAHGLVSSASARVPARAAAPRLSVAIPPPALPPAAQPAPARGVTGTIALPDLPIPIAQGPVETAVAPARPFSLAGASATDRGRALECLAAAIYYEAATESDAGQAAVAQVVLNRVRHPAFPASVCGVVYQGSARAGCQFSFACDGSMARVPARVAWARAARAAAAALNGRVHPTVGLATHYHTYAVTPSWNRSLVMTDMIGAHLFHRWKGGWGTAAAFRQPYAGNEPLPGPHAPIVRVPEIAASLVLPPPPVTDAATVKPAFADTGTPKAPPKAAAADPLPDSGQVLDKWKDSGQPIR